MEKSNSLVDIEVVYGLADRQKLLSIKVAEGTSVREAALQSGMDQHFDDLDLHTAKLGIFGKQVAKPESQTVKAGDRIEIYRPLIADPKKVRAQKAAKQSGD